MRASVSSRDNPSLKATSWILTTDELSDSMYLWDDADSVLHYAVNANDDITFLYGKQVWEDTILGRCHRQGWSNEKKDGQTIRKRKANCLFCCVDPST
jgi:hypothetical protein